MFSNLSNLQQLGLAGNQLSGSVPDFTTLPNLQYLDLSYNQLSGSVPDFSNLPNLQYLYLNSNQLSGSVPDFSNLHELQYLELGSNQLTGSIPDFANLPNLQDLYLSWNQLTGSIPDFANLPNLQYLSLDYNQLEEAVPDFSNLANLKEFRARENQLSGFIPDFSNLPNLQYLDLYWNQLNGTIPDFSNLPNLNTLWLASNQLSGTVPNFSNLSNLQYLYLSNNQLSGVIPATLCSLWYADFGYNKFDIYQTDSCVDNLDYDWKETQTVPPTNIQATALSDSEVKLTWDTIPYTGDGGYYEVMKSTTSGGPYTSAGATASKSDDHLNVTGLTPGNTYYFVVRTFTPAHCCQQNDLTSENSEEVMAMLSSISIESGDVILTWTGDPTFDHYEVLYSENFYFQPDDADVTVDTTSSTSWTHTGAAADVDHNYSYLIRGVYADGAKSDTFNRSGEFTFGLVPGD